MQEEARYDFLTGFLLRHTLEPTLRQLLYEAEVKGESLSVAIVDIDLFKRINDKFGHTCGDDALRYVAGLLRSILQAGEIIFRYGGDEFLIIFPGKNSYQAAQIVRLFRPLALKETFVCNDKTLKITISCGVAHFPHDGKTSEELFRFADRALYFSKHCGRSYVTESNRMAYLKFRNIFCLILGIACMILAPLILNRYVFKGIVGKGITRLLEKKLPLYREADTVTLKNGGVLQGTIVSETKDKISLQLDLGEKQLSTITLNKSEIISFRKNSR